MVDFKLREDDIDRDLQKEMGDEILRVDWTHGAAVRCGAKCLLNIMDGRNKILSSRFTCNSKPYSSKPSMEALFRRGLQPKVVYVDDECCGSWSTVLCILWPDIAVRLDPMHAMMRLTKTTTSTQHPQHGKFCADLAACIFEYDAETLQSLSAAWSREHGASPLPLQVKRKYVPRFIRDPHQITFAVDGLIKKLEKESCGCGHPLFTTATNHAWKSLREHVSNGCLSDPPGISLNLQGEVAIIGGEQFHAIHSLRGTSPVERLHSQQKQWLGIFAQHDTIVGEALLKDGAWRWNCKKSDAE